MDVTCPPADKYGKGPPASCNGPTDPQNKPPTKFESWFTAEMFNDLFPHANIGWGPHKCWPYSYEAFVIAARYFPEFGSEAPNNSFTAEENYKRDLAAFFSHAIQETGENNPSSYTIFPGDKDKADACFYRGGFYNWFEGGPTSGFLPTATPGHDPTDGEKCTIGGLYCSPNPDFPCSNEKDGDYFKGCYFGRGAIQISYNFNYGPFQQWLKEQGIEVDLLKNPNLVITKTDPPLAIMASLWFYMTPQPPKPAMHDIVMGNWKAGDADVASGYTGAIFGPTSLVINNECNGEDAHDPGGPGESRRIKAYKWFSKYFGFKVENQTLLSCKNMQVKFDRQTYAMSYGPNWQTTWKDEPCQCVPQTYPGKITYYAPGYYPQRWTDLNEKNRKACVKGMYEDPATWQIAGQACLKFPPSDIPVPQPQPTPAPQPQPSPSTGGGASGEFSCPSAGMFPNPADCGSYYTCIDAKIFFKQLCPAGLHYNKALNSCDYPDRANCKKSV